MKNESLKRILGNKGLVTIVSAVVCIGILVWAYNYRIKKQINPINVPYAKQDIPARTKITEDMIGTIKVASSMITSTVVINKSSVLNKFVNYNTYIPAGSLFYKNTLVDWEEMPDSAWSNIYTNYTIVSLPVGTSSTYGNSIYPGDKIDLYYLTSDSGKLVYGKLIEGIEVLAVKDIHGNHKFKKSSSQSETAALIFSVPEDLHILLRQAMVISGSSSLIPIPRNSNYKPETNISSEYLRGLIESKTRQVPLDFVNEQNNIDSGINDENIVISE